MLQAGLSPLPDLPCMGSTAPQIPSKAMWNPRLPLASLAQPLTSTGPTFDATCVTWSLWDKIRVRARHRDGDRPIPG